MRNPNFTIKSEKILHQFDLAEKYYNEKNFNDAINVLTQLLNVIYDQYKYEKCEIYRMLGNNYYYLNDYDNAILAYEHTLDFFQNNPSIYNMLGYMYFYKNSIKSIKYYLKAMEMEPNLQNFVMLTQLMIKDKTYSQKDLKTIFEKYIDIFRPVMMAGKPPYEYNKVGLNPNKKLKIGYLSSDLYCHAMMSFMLPIFENHSKDKFDIVLYYCNNKSDIVTERIKKTGLEIKDCSNLSVFDLAEKIHNDGVDILVDISGYTHTAIWSLLYKPAPIIVQYLGFLGTYGMKEVDYILTDKFTIPYEIAKEYTEKPMYIESGMNRFTFNSEHQTLPEIMPLPYENNGYITFGSFNCTSKINPYTVSLWSKVLKAVPDSKLLIYRTQLQERDINRLTGQFNSEGIESSRLIFDNQPTPESHFNAYLKCDIALDPLPFSGLTITIEQAYMGIPTLTLPGDTIAARGAARVNLTIGLNCLVADNESDYVEKALNLANDVNKLRFYRCNLRNIIANSPLCNDFSNWINDLEACYEKAWKEYCLS